MRNSTVLKKLRSGEPSFGTSLHLGSPEVFEMVSLLGMDAIWIDLEHHAVSLDRVAELMRAARVGGTDIVARPAKGEFMRMSRLLELGATGIMYPRCESVDEAREVVQWAKFAPLGKRGFDGSGADVPYLMTPMKKYLRQANEQTFVIIQLETQQAIDQAASIAAVEGVDMLMLGPADFSILSGIPGEFDHPMIQQAYEAVAAAAQAHGKTWAATCGSVGQAKRLIDCGAKLVFLGCDIVFVKQGFDRLHADLRAEFHKAIAPAAAGENGKHYQESSK